jgi:hypothetical protein
MTGIMMKAVWLHHFQFGFENFRHLIFVAHDTIAVPSSLAVSDKGCLPPFHRLEFYWKH